MIDFVIPTTLKEEGLSTAIKLKSTLGDYCCKIIVVVDGHGENIEEFYNEYISIVCKKDLDGSYVARNLGAKYCNSKYIGFIDSDVSISLSTEPDFSFLENELPESALSCYIEFDRNPNNIYEEWYQINAFDMDKFLKRFSFLPTIFIVLPKEIFDRVEGFNEEYLSSGDVDFSHRIKKYLTLQISRGFIAKTDLRSKEKIFRKIKRQVYGQCFYNKLNYRPGFYHAYLIFRAMYNLSGLSCCKYFPRKGIAYNIKYQIANYKISLIKTKCILNALVINSDKLHRNMKSSNNLEVLSNGTKEL